MRHRLSRGVRVAEPALTGELLALLRQLRVANVDGYERKVSQNAGHAEIVRDLLSEGLAAAMFAKNGIMVELRESPDLLLHVCDQLVGAEVKHIRWKEQDTIDDQRMRAAGRSLVELPGTMETESQTAWDSIAAVAEKKVSQCLPDAPNLLVIDSSSSHNLEDGHVLTAAHEIDDRIAAGRAQLSRWSGLLLMSMWLSVPDHRSVYFFELRRASIPVTLGAADALVAIKRRLWPDAGVC